MLGGVSEHSRVLAAAGREHGREVHVWTAPGAAAAQGIQVHTSLGGFTPRDLRRTGTLLDGFPAPRELFVQWVPHGFGYRGMNVGLARWLARRAAAGDRLEVMVHEPFADLSFASWAQPARAALQRYMTAVAIRAARRVWLSIPGWADRLAPYSRETMRVLAIPGTIPRHDDGAAVRALRHRLCGAHGTLLGYFGAGDSYAEGALASLLARLSAMPEGSRLVLIGRGTTELASRLAKRAAAAGLHATGAIDAVSLSHHLSACDLLVQPYLDGVSGRRTTTISALEHGIPVATTRGALSEAFWLETDAVATVPAAAPQQLGVAVETLLEPGRLRRARCAARDLYESRFAPAVALQPLFVP